MPTNAQNPHLGDEYSPLDKLIQQALRRYGEFSPGAVDGDVSLMFLEFANHILIDIRRHPYWREDPPEYYTALNDSRPVPDEIITAGLIAHYALQQNSPRAETSFFFYNKTVNTILWDRLNGNTPLRVRPMDGGALKSESPATNMINGQPE